MSVTNSRLVGVAIGASRTSIDWVNTNFLWNDFVERLRVPIRTSESYEDYLKLSPSEQANLKDVGGFVGGTLLGKRRKRDNIISRDLITLDLDNIPAGETENIITRVESLGCCSAIYSTRKHSDYTPRLRVIFATNRSMSPDEYEPCARKLAEYIGIAYADPTTFDISRLMYWPSCSKDSVYVFKVIDAPFADVDGLLALYDDWRDITTWPQVPGADVAFKKLQATQTDPEAKEGIVGAFCRAYDVLGAMEAFIPDLYAPAQHEGRYTYLGGTTSGGAVIYENGKFLYSHHSTDPCSMRLVNAWDMVRLHKFGSLDDKAKEETPPNRLPSYVAMKELALQDPKVKALVNRERQARVGELFSEIGASEPPSGLIQGSGDGTVTDTSIGVPGEQEGQEQAQETDWMQSLEMKGTDVASTINNVVLILKHDPLLKDRIVLDEFANRGMVIGLLPWDSSYEGSRLWTDHDSANIYHYLEVAYKIVGNTKIDTALTAWTYKRKINEVEEYLKSLKWDGIKRIDTLLHDYMGAEYNVYTRDVMRKALCAGVARAVVGNTKYDTMPILAGKQGIGKSTFLRKLGKRWFCDSLQNFEGKESAEVIQGQWIVEVSELTAMTKSETNAIKQFLSKEEDVYRAAYGRHTSRYPRRCVFFGTSNDDEFLKDVTGNRRFWPVTCGEYPPKKSVFKDLDGEVDQIWAEAFLLWQLGEKLYLEGESEKLSEEAQAKYRETSYKFGIIHRYLNTKIPVKEVWESWDTNKRRQWILDKVTDYKGELVDREKVCAIEIWVECFGGYEGYLKRQDSNEIVNIMKEMPCWKRNKTNRNYGVYGNQRGFEKIFE